MAPLRPLRRTLLATLSVLPLAACAGSSAAPLVSASHSTLSTDAVAGLGADGTEFVQVTVTVRDAAGQPLAGRDVELLVSGHGNTVLQPGAPSDASGNVTGSLATTSAEWKTISAVVDPGTSSAVTLDATAAVEFVWVVPGTFLVRNGGSDANSGRSPASAWASLSHAASQVGPGQRVVVGAGTYTDSVTLTTSGTFAQPVVFTADRSGAWTGDAGEVVVDAAGAPHVFHVAGASFVRIEGFTLTGAAPGGNAGGAVRVGAFETSERVQIRGNVIYGNDRGIDVRNAYDLALENNRISNNVTGEGQAIRLDSTMLARVYNNLVYNNGGHGLCVRNFSDGVFVFFNTLYASGGHQLFVDGAGNSVALLHNILVAGLSDGIHVGAGDSVVESGNLVFAHSGTDYVGLAPSETDLQVDPLLLDPAGPDGLLGGAEGADDAFQLDHSALLPSPAVDAGVSNAQNFVLTDGTSLAECTSFASGGLDGTVDGPLANLGYHYPAAVDELGPLGANDVRATFARGLERQAFSRKLSTAAESFEGALRAPTTGRRIHWIEHCLSPLASGEELVGQLSADSGASDLDVLLWNGAGWERVLTSAAIAEADAALRGFDVAFESTSGDALVVYSVGSANPRFVARTSGAWSQPTEVFASAPTTGKVLWVELVARPDGDEVALAYADDLGQLGAVVWNGANWDELGTAARLGGGLTGVRDSRGFDLAFESTTGDLLAAWGENGELGFATLSGGVWTSGSEAGAGTAAEVVRLSGDPRSDRIAAVAGDGVAGTNFGALLWDGAAWSDVAALDDSAGSAARDAAVAWLGDTVVFLYRDDDGGGSLDWGTWDAGNGWSLQGDAVLTLAELTDISLTSAQANSLLAIGDVVSMQLEGRPDADVLHALLSDDTGSLFAATFDGLTWSLVGDGTPLETSLPANPPGCEPHDLVLAR